MGEPHIAWLRGRVLMMRTHPASSALLHSSAPGSTYQAALAELAASRVALGLVVARSTDEAEEVTLSRVARGEHVGVVVTATALSSLDARLGVVDLPYLLDSRETWARFWGGALAAELLAGLPAHGLRCLAVLDAGLRHFFADSMSIEAPRDLSGRHFRVLPSIHHARWLASMGAHPVPVPPSGFRAAMVAGGLDGAERSLSNILEYDLEDLARQVSLTGHLAATAFLVVSERWWRDLAVGEQEALLRAGNEIGVRQVASYTDRDREAAATLAASGARITLPDIDAFRASAQSTHREFAAEIAHGAALIARVREESS